MSPTTFFKGLASLHYGTEHLHLILTVLWLLSAYIKMVFSFRKFLLYDVKITCDWSTVPLDVHGQACEFHGTPTTEKRLLILTWTVNSFQHKNGTLYLVIALKKDNLSESCVQTSPWQIEGSSAKMIGQSVSHKCQPEYRIQFIIKPRLNKFRFEQRLTYHFN